MGLSDFIRKNRILVFGPNKYAAKLEGSKAFMKNLCKQNNIPTAKYGIFEKFEDAKDFIKKSSIPIVVKADGLAAGKGVTICQNKKKVLKVVAAQPSKLTINGLSEFIDTYSDISKDDVRIAKNDTILFKNIDKEKKYSESVFLNRSTGELIHEVTKNMNTKDNEKYISFFGCTKEL